MAVKGGFTDQGFAKLAWYEGAHGLVNGTNTSKILRPYLPFECATLF